MLNFMIPGMYEHVNINLRLISLIKERPEMFYDGVNISAVYGNFQYCIWDGGRVFNEYHHTNKEQMAQIIKDYNSLQVPIRYVFTSCKLTEAEYYNRFGNLCLDLGQNGFNEIVVNDPGLEDYIRTHYPNYDFISSTTKCLTKVEDFKAELEKDYKFICLDYNLNHNFDMLYSLPEDQRGKCEFLVNAICPSGCPNRKRHYELNSLYYLNYSKPYKIASCAIKRNTVAASSCAYPNHVSIEEIQEKYEPYGFEYFKLEGRTLSELEVICNYAVYMVKPEHRMDFILCMGG